MAVLSQVFQNFPHKLRVIRISLTPIRFQNVFALSFMLKPARSQSKSSNPKNFWLFLCCPLFGTHLRVYSHQVSCRNFSITQQNRIKKIQPGRSRASHCGLEKDHKITNYTFTTSSTPNTALTMATAQQKHHNNESSCSSSNTEDYNETDERRRKFFNKIRGRNVFGYVNMRRVGCCVDLG